VIRRPIPLICCFLFVLIGFAFTPQAGIENDEALFGSVIYQQPGIDYGDKIAGHHVPLMLMSYLGALKSWVYAPIFRFWRPSVTSLRVPVILLGAVTVWLFFILLQRIADDRTAIVGTVLLSTDTLFLLTTCYDWGPVVLQHLLLVSGVLCLLRFHQDRRPRFLAAGFFLFGLGLWDKALFFWILSGISAATLIVFPRELWKSLSPRNLTTATLAFCLGSAPLIVYNIQHPLETFRANAAYAADDISNKGRLLRATIEGRVLFGFISRDDPAGHPRGPESAIDRFSVWLSEKTGGQRINFFAYALFFAAILAPLLWRTPARRPLMFSALAMLIAWLQMALNKNTGGSAHHSILIWPFPILFIAIAFAAASRRIGSLGKPLLVAVVMLVAGSGLLVTNEYFAQSVRNGTGEAWTDAIFPLSDYLKTVKAQLIYIDDWGILDTLHLLHRGQLPLREGSDPLSKPQLDQEEKLRIINRIAEPDSLFVGHTDAYEFFKGVNAKLLALADEAGYRRVMLAVIPDRNGRAMFEVFRFERAR